jgi:branched-subunit amino acid transport protein AzlD
MAVAMLTTAITIVLAFLIAEARPTDEPWVHLMAEAIGTGIFVLLFVSSAALFRRAAHSSSTV